MKRLLAGFVLGVVLTLGLLLSVVALAQDEILSLVQPLVVDVRQTVPIVADVVVPLEDGESVTATVPLTLDIALQVAVSGVVSELVEVVEETEPEVSLATPTPAIAEGEPVVYDLLWQVEEVEDLGQNLSMGDADYLQFETSGKFLLLHLLLENVGTEPRNVGEVSYRDLQTQLIDNQDRTFAPFETGYSLDELCGNVAVNPGLTVSCVIPYEVPANASGFSLLVTLETDDGEIQTAQIPLAIE
jgi:hypothetical protein